MEGATPFLLEGVMHRLPNGEYTQFKEIYLRAWQQLAEPVEKLTGYKLESFDPDFQFVDWDAPGQPSVALSARFVVRLVAGIKARGSNKAANKEVTGALKMLTVHTNECTGCGVKVHSMGYGRPRRTCPECRAFNRKQRNMKYREQQEAKS